MAKRVAVLAVNPVNGMGLFQYLEGFYENKIGYRVYAVAETTDIRTNSGIALRTDDTVEHLKGRAGEYDALVFFLWRCDSCFWRACFRSSLCCYDAGY